jgi:hypothetical protein
MKLACCAEVSPPSGMANFDAFVTCSALQKSGSSLGRAMLEQHSSAQQSSGSGSRDSSQQQPGSARSAGGSPHAALDKSTYQALPPGQEAVLGA